MGLENCTTGLSLVEKTYNRPGGRRKCTPFGGWRHHLPPGGGTLFFAMR